MDERKLEGKKRIKEREHIQWDRKFASQKALLCKFCPSLKLSEVGVESYEDNQR